ncbi:MAG TPA: polysaccharide deacetylase family protein [Tepidisphaeraceae bacterium]|nr:polysaccharide deacetylase family protein [Tepidisphaeraceae bacterium]
MLHSPRSGIVHRLARRVRNLLDAKAVILCYHRVADLSSDPFEIGVSSRLFAEQLEAVRKCGIPVSLTDLVEGLRKGRVPHRAVAITFDDGYADVLHEARPLLERHDVPATAFLVSGAVGQSGEFWWDELERIFLQPGRLPQKLSMKIAGADFHGELGDSREYSEQAWQAQRGWRFEQPAPGARQALFHRLHPLLGKLDEPDRKAAMGELRRWAGMPELARATHRTLDASEVVRLAAGGLVEIGGHTVSHPMLPTLSGDRQRQEVAGCKSAIEQIVGRPIRHFCYPYGWHEDPTVQAVREAGYESACSLIPVPLRHRWDAMRLPRLWARPWAGEELERRLKGWFAGR